MICSKKRKNENMKSQKNDSRPTTYLLACLMCFVAASKASAVDPLKALDPCTKAKKQLEAAISNQVAAFKRERVRPRNLPISEQDAQELWNTLALEKAVNEIHTRYRGVKGLTEDQMAEMAAREVAGYKAKLGAPEYRKELSILQKQATQASMSDAERQYAVEAKAQRNALRTACGNGEIEKALRIAGAFAQKRWNSMRTENTPWDKAIKFATDISVRDMERYGLLGGPNSDARKVGKRIEKGVAAQFAKAGISGVSLRTPGGGPNSEVNTLRKKAKHVARQLGLHWF